MTDWLRKNRRLIQAVLLGRLKWYGLVPLLIVGLWQYWLIDGPLRGNDRDRYEEKTFRVVNVVDGDTVDLDVGDSRTGKDVTRVRLWGVDTPETKHPKMGVMFYGPEASVFTKEKVLDQMVLVRLEPFENTRGKYGRLLAYLYLPDGQMLNEMLLSQGYAYADYRFEHVYKARFLGLEKEARREGRGLWQEAKEEDWPEWFRRRYGKVMNNE